MKENRLEELYRRRLVRPEVGGRKFPLAHLLQKPAFYFPQKPVLQNFEALEIGPGTGDFLMHLAEQNPTWKVLGIEIGELRFERIRERLQKKEIANVTLVHADARGVLRTDLNEQSFSRVYVLFPDPWPRNCHRHRRLLTQDFLELLVEKITPGGFLQLATDVEDYALWVKENLKKVSQFIVKEDGTSPPELITTYFARKWRERGRATFYVRAERV